MIITTELNDKEEPDPISELHEISESLEQDRQIGRIRLTLLIVSICLALLALLVAAFSIPFGAPVASPLLFKGWPAGLLLVVILFVAVPMLALVIALFLSLSFVAHSRYWYRFQFLFLILFGMMEGFLLILSIVEVFDK